MIYCRFLYKKTNDRGKEYVAWLSFQWNLKEEISMTWPQNQNELQTFLNNQILTQIVLERLRSRNLDILENDFLCKLHGTIPKTSS